MKKFSKALITGATSGIGKALALLLAEKKVELILAGRNEIALYELASNLTAQVPVHRFRGNLTRRDDLEELLTLISQHAPDLVINNAGFGAYGNFVDHSWEEFEEMIALHCSSLMAITHQAVSTLIAQKKQGTIVNISSFLGDFACPGHAVYAATKAFVTNFSKTLDYELQPQGVRVLVSCPGYVVTPFRSRASAGTLRAEKSVFSLEPERVARLIVKQAEKRKRYAIIDWRYRLLSWLFWCLPEKIVNAILYRVNKKPSQ